MSVVARTVLREQVKEVLLERILRGELKPGDRLVETRIAQELGTSQAPVREALRDLELRQPRRVGAVPRRAGARRLRRGPAADLPGAGGAGGARCQGGGTPVAGRRLGTRGRDRGDARRREARGYPDAAQPSDIAFHRAVVEASGNRVLLQAWLALGIEVPTAFGVYWTYFDAMELVEFHVSIMEAIRSGDPARAGAEARAHVRRTEKVVRRRRREAR